MVGWLGCEWGGEGSNGSGNEMRTEGDDTRDEDGLVSWC